MHYVSLTQGKSTSVDDADFVWLSKKKWLAIKRGYNWYAARNEGGQMLFMHREITKCPKGFEVDHIDGDGLNNSRRNLRVCSRSQNKMNCKSPSNNTSGVKGVSYVKTKGTWYAYIKINGKMKNLGTYRNKGKAIAARQKAERELFGEFAFKGVF